MGRRTAWWCGRTVMACVAALCAVAVLPGRRRGRRASRRMAAGFADHTPSPTTPEQVEGASNTTDAVRLEPGRDLPELPPEQRKAYYRLGLDAASNAYVSATAVPGRGRRSPPRTASRCPCRTPTAASCFSGHATTRSGPPQPAPRRRLGVTRDRPRRLRLPGGRDVLRRRGAHPAERAPRRTTGSLELHVRVGARASEQDRSDDGPRDLGLRLARARSPATPKPPRGRHGLRRRRAPWSRASGKTTSGPGRRFLPGPGRLGAAALRHRRTGQRARRRRLSWATPSSCRSTTPCAASSTTLAPATTARQKTAALDPLPPVAYANRYTPDDRVERDAVRRLVLPRRASRRGGGRQVRRGAVSG